jgi:hypothetical protein
MLWGGGGQRVDVGLHAIALANHIVSLQWHPSRLQITTAR